LTRSTRINGSPMVPSRWLQKIENCLTTIENGYSFPTNYQYLNWFLQIDSPSSICPRPPPCPRPPLESRPKTLSVTSVETWIRDPYSIFAEQISTYDILGFFQLSAIFTTIALVRKYTIRRWFENLKGKF
jgi:ATP-dependent helicase/nuclease subunit B